MAYISTHMQDCVELLGDSFEHVHRWMDFFKKLYPGDKYGTYHRSFRHTMDTVRIMAQTVGKQEALAVIVHLLRDVEGYKPTKSDLLFTALNGLDVKWDRA